MICIVDKNGKVVNIINADELSTPDRREYYPWLSIGEAWCSTMPLDYAKKVKHAEAGLAFARQRDKVRYIALNGQSYGFDCAPVDITNFMANMKRAELLGTSEHKVFHEGAKRVVEFSYLNFKTVLLSVSEDQLKWYDWYKKKVAEIEGCQTVEEVQNVSLNCIESDPNKDQNTCS